MHIKELMELEALREFVKWVNMEAGTAENGDVLITLSERAGELMIKHNIPGKIYSQNDTSYFEGEDDE